MFEGVSPSGEDTSMSGRVSAGVLIGITQGINCGIKCGTSAEAMKNRKGGSQAALNGSEEEIGCHGEHTSERDRIEECTRKGL
jgi:hypothetical protein